MSDSTPRLERFLERAAGLMGGSSLHPLVLLQEVHAAAERSVRSGAVANAYTLGLSPADAPVFERHARQLTGALVRMLDELAGSQHLQRAAPWELEFVSREGVRPGAVEVRAEFRHQTDRAVRTPGPTRAIRRHRSAFLVVDGNRLRLTHTPFTIGRGPDCDLSIPDLAVSRRHACIDVGDDGEMLLRDLGSRNKLVVNGTTVSEAALEAGVVVTIGSTEIRLEFAE